MYMCHNITDTKTHDITITLWEYVLQLMHVHGYKFFMNLPKLRYALLLPSPIWMEGIVLSL